MKTFTSEFDKFLLKIKNKEPFAFSRFSDGELFMLQNKEVQLADNHYVTGDIKGGGRYTKEEHKHFIPGEHEFYRQKLVDSLQYKAPEYYKGICSRGDVSKEDFDFQINLHGGEDDSLTFANLFINSNYPRYINEIVPRFSEYKGIVLVANESSDFGSLPFHFKDFRFFRVGSNCIINDFHQIPFIKEYLYGREGWLVLCSASTLSNYIIHECFKDNPKNTLLDIGSSLNPYLKLEGWKYSRGYLQHFWLNMPSQFATREEVW